MYKAVILFSYALATCACAQIQGDKEPTKTKGEGEVLISWGYPISIASKEQPEPVTVFLEMMEISTSDGRGVFTVNATVFNNTDFTLQFIANSKDQCLLLVEPIPATKAKKPPQAISLTPPIKTITVKPHSSIKAQGSMDIGNQQIKDFESIRVRPLQVTDAFLRIKVKPDGDVRFLPE